MQRRQFVVGGPAAAVAAAGAARRLGSALGAAGSARWLAAAAAAAGTAFAQQPDSGRVVEIVARKFAYTPDEITLRRGQPVVLTLTAPEVVMGFHAPELQLRTIIVPGQGALVRFTPATAGTFAFVCDVFCGDGHESMAGRIVVVG